MASNELLAKLLIAALASGAGAAKSYSNEEAEEWALKASQSIVRKILKEQEWDKGTMQSLAGDMTDEMRELAKARFGGYSVFVDLQVFQGTIQDCHGQCTFGNKGSDCFFKLIYQNDMSFAFSLFLHKP